MNIPTRQHMFFNSVEEEILILVCCKITVFRGLVKKEYLVIILDFFFLFLHKTNIVGTAH